MSEILFVFILLSIWNMILTFLLFVAFDKIKDLKDLIHRLDDCLFDTKVDLDVLEKELYETQDSVVYKEGKNLGE